MIAECRRYRQSPLLQFHDERRWHDVCQWLAGAFKPGESASERAASPARGSAERHPDEGDHSSFPTIAFHT
jgi:hypothetical protein